MIWPQSSSNKSARYFASRCAGQHTKLKCIAASVLGNSTDAEDIVQQAYQIAITKNQQFPTQDKFIGWLVGIVKHCALNHRKKKRVRKTFATDTSTLDRMVEQQSNPESFDSISGARLEDVFDDDVLRALNALTDDARICLLLRVVEKLTYKEIASYMDIPEGTAMSMVHRARTSLRQSLESHEFPDHKG